MLNSISIALLLSFFQGSVYASHPEGIALVQDQAPQLPALDASVQSAIGRVMQVGAKLSAAQVRAELDALEGMAGADYSRLVPQLFLFSRQATSTREAMAFGAIVGRLRISDGAVLRALVPLLEVRDAKLPGELAGYLSEYEGAGAGRRPSFEYYREFLSLPLAQAKPMPAGLLRYLYARDAGQAALLLMGVSRASAAERREILWAEHRIADVRWQEQHGFRERGTPDADAGRELNRMALHATWYARLFAVQVLAESPHLGERVWLKKLGQDSDARVRAAALRAMNAK